MKTEPAVDRGLLGEQGRVVRTIDPHARHCGLVEALPGDLRSDHRSRRADSAVQIWVGEASAVIAEGPRCWGASLLFGQLHRAGGRQASLVGRLVEGGRKASRRDGVRPGGVRREEGAVLRQLVTSARTWAAREARFGTAGHMVGSSEAVPRSGSRARSTTEVVAAIYGVGEDIARDSDTTRTADAVAMSRSAPGAEGSAGR